MQLSELAATSDAVAAEASRTAKRDRIAALLAAAGDDVALAVEYLTARPRQRRTGVGWRALGTLPEPAQVPSLSLQDVDRAFEAMAALTGPGSDGARRALVAQLFGRATADEQRLLRAVLAGELRQGALAGVVEDAVARAAGVPLAAVRRAAMLSGSLSRTAVIALRDGVPGLATVGLRVGIPLQPMLAGSAPSIAAALEATGDGHRVAIDAKVDGVRVQIHRDGDRVHIFSRTLDDLTARMPEVVERVRALPVRQAIIDGEAVAIDRAGRPHPFQVTGARSARGDGGAHADVPLTLYAFDLLHLDGEDLIDRPLRDRVAALTRVAADTMVPQTITADPAQAEAAFAHAIAHGFEGVVIKDLDAPYAAGRRGRAWVKVKPVQTLDLVVLAVEWGSGRRTGKLSNIHLGARDPDTGGFVMVGKTFKGMTDAMLAWQTERFLTLATHRSDHVVWVRPEQVVEIAFDGVQRSRRYPGGAAMRFARVLRYRDDKPAEAADTITAVRSFLDRREGEPPQ